MGQNICTNVTVCCSAIIEADSMSLDEPLMNHEPSEKTGKHATREQSQQQAINQEQIAITLPATPREPQSQPEPTESVISLEDLVHSLTDIRNSYLDMRSPKELFLSIDEVWSNQMRLIDRPLAHYYTRLADNEYTRNREDNSKFQLLFRQHFPCFGLFYFEVTLTNYEPRSGCEFTVGVVNYLQAVKHAHSRGCFYEKSYTYRIHKDISEQVEPIKRIDVCLRVEVNRVNNAVVFYVNHKEVDRRLLEGEIVSGTSSLAPYLQTQGLGVTFNWSKPPEVRSATYKMSTILEEESSIRATH